MEQEATVEPVVCKEMCAGCPFHKESLEGWLGPYGSPEELHRLISAEMPFPCHKKMDRTVDPQEAGTKRYPLCRGALAYMKKNGKSPRAEYLRKAMDEIKGEELEQTFYVPEFIKHHTI